jgi:hypothetical protein
METLPFKRGRCHEMFIGKCGARHMITYVFCYQSLTLNLRRQSMVNRKAIAHVVPSGSTMWLDIAGRCTLIRTGYRLEVFKVRSVISGGQFKRAGKPTVPKPALV